MVRQGLALLSPRARTPRRLRRPAIEALESRRLLANVQWIAPTSGDWNTPADWSAGQVPGAGDNVTIDVPGVTVTISSGSETVGSITSSDPITLDGGSLTVSSGVSTLTGGLTMNGGSLTADGAGVSLTASGTTSVSSASLYAQDGASLSLPDLSSLSSPVPVNTVYNASATFMARGSGSTLMLSGLTSVSTLSENLAIQAEQGGQVLLPALTELNSSSTTFQITSSGVNSLVDLSSLRTFDESLALLPVDSGYFEDSLATLDSGTVLDGSLQNLNGVNVTLDGAPTMAVAQWTSYTNGNLTVNAGVYLLSELSTITGSSFSVNGGSLVLSAATSYASPTTWLGTTFQATGPGSVLSLPSLTSLGSFNSKLVIQASQGAQTLLPALTAINIPEIVQITASGSGSVIDLSALQTFNDPAPPNIQLYPPIVGVLWATNSATILDGSLRTLNNVDVTLDGTGTMAVAQWTSFTNGALDVAGGDNTLSGLTTITGSGFVVSNGGVAAASLTLPAVTTYSNPMASDPTAFSSYGEGAVLSFPNLTSLGSLCAVLYIKAEQGGKTLFPALAAINTTFGGQGSVQIAAAGANSEVDLSALTAFVGPSVGAGPNRLDEFLATDSGTILDGSLRYLNGVNVNLDGAPTMAVAQWTSFTNGTLTVNAGVYLLSELATITGSSFFVTGGNLMVSAATYSNPTGSATTSFQANGAGAVLSFPYLSALGTLDGALSIQSLWGGQTLLPALTAIKTAQNGPGYVQIWASGSGSQIDLSALRSFMGGVGGVLSATQSGTILDPALTSLSGVSVTLDDTGTVNDNLWTSLTNGSLTVTGGSVDLAALTDVNGSSLTASNGFLSLPGVTRYTSTTVGPNGADAFAAVGPSGVLSLPYLTTVDINPPEDPWGVSATQGGHVFLPMLANMSTTATNQAGARFTADGSGSLINLSSLTTPTGTFATFTATNGGTIDLAHPPTPPPPPPPPPSAPPLVALASVLYVENKAQKVTEILLTFNGPLDAAAADQIAAYRLATPGKNGAFTAKSAGTIALGSAVYNGSNLVALYPKTPFTVSKPVRLMIHGGALSGDAVELLTKNTPHRLAQPPKPPTVPERKVVVHRRVAHSVHDAALFSRGELTTHAHRGELDLVFASVHHERARRG